MTTPNLYQQMFETVQSLHFGRTFWIDEENEFCSAPTFKDGTTDWDMWDYVTEWTEPLERIDLERLLQVHRTCIENNLNSRRAEDFT